MSELTAWNQAAFWTWLPVVAAWAVPIGFYFGRQYLAARIEKGVQFRFDRDLEELRSEIQKNEETFRSDLASKQSEIAAIREGALSGVAGRQAALDQRRLEAVNILWAEVIELSRLEGTALLVLATDPDSLTEQKLREPKTREYFKTLSASIDLKTLPGMNAAKQRPFVSDLAWALFSAYQAILIFAVGQVKFFAAGFDKPIDASKVSALLKAVLPEYSSYVDQYRSIGHFQLLDRLKERIVLELRNVLDNPDADKAVVERSKQILSAVKELQGQLPTDQSQAIST